MCHKIVIVCFLTIIIHAICDVQDNNIPNRIENDETLMVTVASEQTDGFKQYLRSAQQYGMNPIVLGMNKPWKGGDMRNYPGGGYKINLFRNFLEKYKDDQERLVIFTDSYDVMFLSNLDDIIRKFLSFKARILFSSESSCWPDTSLVEKYPKSTGNRYLNSGIFMGYANDIYKMLTVETIDDTGDDQLFYTKVFVNKDVREKLNIKLDHQSEVFQNLYGAADQVTVLIKNNNCYLANTFYETQPLILHGNGRSKPVLNSLGNYLANSWNLQDGCILCKENEIDLTEKEVLPLVVIGVFIERATPFLEDFFEALGNLNYPKDRIHVFIHNDVEYHENVTKKFVDSGDAYASIKQIFPKDNIKESDARDLGMEHCVHKQCDYYFNLDAEAYLENPYTLKLLISQNRTFVAPMLTRHGKVWSNFWGALSPDGFYARSFDYMEIAQNERKGLWNVPFISSCYLINATLFKKHSVEVLNYQHNYLDPDMAFCDKLRDLNVFMYVTNREHFGFLINTETFKPTLASPEMYQLFDNRYFWEKRYIHPEYYNSFNKDVKPLQPCPDVFWFPIVTLRFCNDLINMVETFGQWSDGTNYDPRLNTGYEAVPTRDIHMKQVDYDYHWLQFLKDYVQPLQEMTFLGYHHDPPESLMNFVVRYRPDEQPSLRPHHDTSTYTINIALNQHGIDYEGGGCRFIRYNCSVTDTKPGWLLMHPGRLTHFHEGLTVTKGTRYIMISFVNP